MTGAVPRYAIYFAPPATSPLWQFGCGVIGYDASCGCETGFAQATGLDDGIWGGLVAEPRRYGFHATLKAPFEPAAGLDEDAILGRVAALAGDLAPVELSRLEVAELGRFIALVPAASLPELNALEALAGRVVADLEPLRRPLLEADRARRLKSALTSRQIMHLDRFGYPYVFEDYRFHMTLTGPVTDDGLRGRVRAALAADYEARVPRGPVVVDALVVFRQDRREDRFRIKARLALSGRQSA